MKKYILTFIYLLFIIPTSVVFAQIPPEAVTGDYVVLAPLPGTTQDPNCPGTKCVADINSYLSGFLGLVIGVGAIIAMLMLAYYGFQYALADSSSVKMADKEKLLEILQGLLLIISAYAIMYTINPALVENLSLQIKSPKLNDPTVSVIGTNGAGTSGDTVNTTPGVPMAVDQILQSNAVRTSLANEGVNTYQGPCTMGQTKACVNLNGLTETTKTGLVTLKNSCGAGCEILITGGTEPAHDPNGSHPKGLGIDLAPNSKLNEYLKTPNPDSLVTKNAQGKLIGPTQSLVINGKNVNFTYEVTGGNAGGTSTGNHWHIDF